MMARGCVLLVGVIAFGVASLWGLSGCWGISDEVCHTLNYQKSFVMLCYISGCFQARTMLLHHVNNNTGSNTNLLLHTQMGRIQIVFGKLSINRQSNSLNR